MGKPIRSAVSALAAMLCLLALLSFAPWGIGLAYADGGEEAGGGQGAGDAGAPVDGQGGGISLTVHYDQGERFVEGAQVSIYRVADISSDGSLVPVEGFSSYPVNWNVKDAAEARALADTLESYVILGSRSRLALPADDACTTDANGVAVFPSNGSSLEPGYYLVMASPHSTDEEFHEPSASLVSLPYEGEDGSVETSPSIQLKLSTFSMSARCTIDVAKIWQGDAIVGATQPPSTRPSEATVHLLCDGQYYDEATLSDENGWHAAWGGLRAGHKWTVVEVDVPDYYVVSVERNGYYVSLVNTCTLEPPSPDDDKENPSGGTEKLPQTGMLWWPVPLLLLAGVFMLFMGRRKAR